MKTYEIKKEEVKGEPVAYGYKAINWDSSTRGDSLFKYGEIDEKLVGKIFRVDGDIAECKWGLHFSEDPAYVFNFYEPLGYNRYFKVAAYEKAVKSDDGFKTVAQCIEFIEEYDLMKFIEIIKLFDRRVTDSSAVRGSSAVTDSYGIKNCEAVKNCLFCAGIEAKKYYLFNKKTTAERFDEVFAKIRSFNWYPSFANWYDIKGNKEWWAFCFPQLKDVDPVIAWGKMPEKMKEYIFSLPEFNEKVWKKVIGEGETK